MIDVVEEKKVELAEPSKEYAASPQIVRQKQ